MLHQVLARKSYLHFVTVLNKTYGNRTGKFTANLLLFDKFHET